MKNPEEKALVGQYATNIRTGAVAKVREANEEGGVYVQYIDGFLAGRHTWHRIADLTNYRSTL